MRAKKFLSWAGIAQIVLCGVLAACVPIPHPMTKRTRGTGDTELAAEPELSGINARVTSRAEVLERFAPVKAWVSERLFLGRWKHSGMGTSGDRQWFVRNLLVQFDDANIVQRYVVCSNDDLIRQLPSYLDPKTVTNDLAKPTVRSVSRRAYNTKEANTEGLYSATQLEIEPSRLTFDNITIIREQIIKLTPGLKFEEERGLSDPGKFLVAIHLREKIHNNEKLYLKTDIPTFVLLIEFMQPPTSH